MKTLVSVGLVQVPIQWESPKENCTHIEQLLTKSRDQVDLIVLPEMFATGFSMQPAPIAEEMDGYSVSWMKDLSLRFEADVTGSLIIHEGDKYFNRVIWIRAGAILATYDKRHLFTKAGEHVEYTAGSSRTYVDWMGFRCLPLICYDLRFPVWSRNPGDVSLMIYVANWPAVRAYAWNQLLRARAIENQCYVVGVNRIGEDPNGNAYLGQSQVIDPYGKVLMDLAQEQKIGVMTLDLGCIDEIRQRIPFLADKDEFRFV